MQLRILSAEDVHAMIDMRGAIEAMREAFGALSAGRVRAPLRQSIEADHGVTLFMPAYLTGAGALGAKVVSVYAGNVERGLPAVTAAVLLLDAATGRPRALMDGTYLTALRTGAAAGLATELLAREDAAVLTVFGAGVQARTQITAVRAVRPIREVRVVARTRASAERLAAELEGVAAAACDDRRMALRGADIVTTATTSRVPVFDGAAVEPGTHVNGVGSYTPEMQEVDATLVQRAKVVVDTRAAALAEAGDLIVPIRRGRIEPAHIHAELGEVLGGARPGRATPDEITFFKSVGHAAQDMAVAAEVLRRAESEGRGTVVEL